MVSVCMATYNGENFIQEQLDSIIRNISRSDEIIISDDGSTDATLDILHHYAVQYNNIHFFQGPGKGVIKNFEFAINQANGDYIFLTDQDDVWEINKVEKVLDCFHKKHCKVVVHDATIIDGTGKLLEESFFAYRSSKAGVIKNFVKNSYLGCCMAFKREILTEVLPIPNQIAMHDWWIGMISELEHGSVFISDKLIRYRRHGNNVSSMHHYPLKKMIKIRMYLAKELVKRKGK